MQIRDGDSAGIASCVIEADFHGGPIRAKCEMFRPFDNHDGLF
jgi:hypothetical protein